LCLRAAKSGGVSQFSGSHLVHEELRASRPDLLARLYRGYHYHRLGEQADGDDPVTLHRVAVFSECCGQLSGRYVRQYIEIVADDHPDTVLDDLDREALDQFEIIAGASQFEFTLEPGEAIVANNYIVLHARTGLDDYPEPVRKRRLLRCSLLPNLSVRLCPKPVSTAPTVGDSSTTGTHAVLCPRRCHNVMRLPTT